MEIKQAQFAQIEHCLPVQRGNVSLSNLRVFERHPVRRRARLQA